MSLNPNKLSYNMDEAAAVLGVTRKRVQAQVDRKRVPSFMWSGRRLIKAEAVEALRARFAELDSRCPVVPVCGVYLLWQDGLVTYVGRSINIPVRLQNHQRSGREFERVEIIPCDPKAADWLEGEMIRVLRPPENVVRYARRDRRRRGLRS